MNSYYIVYEAIVQGTPPRTIRASAFVDAPPLSKRTMEQMISQLEATIQRQAGCLEKPSVIIQTVIRLDAESRIIMPGNN